MHMHQDKGVDVSSNDKEMVLRDIKLMLSDAAKMQACPGCKHDMEQLAKSVESKMEFICRCECFSDNAQTKRKEIECVQSV